MKLYVICHNEIDDMLNDYENISQDWEYFEDIYGLFHARFLEFDYRDSQEKQNIVAALSRGGISCDGYACVDKECFDFFNQ